MPQLFVPEIGSELVLAEDWTFQVYPETRNDKLIEKFNLGRYQWMSRYIDNYRYAFVDEETSDLIDKTEDMIEARHENEESWSKRHDLIVADMMAFYKTIKNDVKESVPFTFPAGTLLKVDRIYIRKGAKEFSSITFYAGEKKNKVRFWAKLSDCNKIVFQ